MNQELKNIIKERLDRLPFEVVAAIRSIPLVERIRNIAKTNKLNEEREALFITETMIAVLGIESPQKYPVNLAEKVGLSDDMVIKIAKEVDEQIITPILNMIEEIKQKKPDEGVWGKKPEILVPTSVPEILPINLPMVAPTLKEVGVPTQPGAGVGKEAEKVPLPDYRYEGGKDPYREPLK